MALHESGQMYLEAIYVLSQKSTKIRAIDVGAYLGYTKPSVSRAIGILKKGEYIAVDADGYITLSPAGKQLAEQLYERHTVLSNMLMILGVDEKTATEDACRIEHVISEQSFDAVKKHYLDYQNK
jgi:Mn-dependent DtxR family transcriptional regulator